MADKDIIFKNFEEYFSLANYAFENKKFNGAVTLFYKALVELCDLDLLSKTGKIGVTHSERFLMLKSYSPDLYKISNKLFRFYRDSYTKEISEIVAKTVKENVERAKRIVIDKEKG